MPLQTPHPEKTDDARQLPSQDEIELEEDFTPGFHGFSVDILPLLKWIWAKLRG